MSNELAPATTITRDENTSPSITSLSSSQSTVAMRNTWVDYAKAIGIILVVYGHITRGLFNAHIPMDESVYRTVDAIIYSFHMPLFFFLSGLFFLESLQKRGIKGLLLNKTDTILYPYLIWSILQGSIEVFLGRWTNGQTTFSQVFNLLWEPRAQFWFLYALFLVSAVAAFTYSLTSKRYLLAVAIVGVCMYLLRWTVSGIPPLNFIFANFVYFSIGIVFKEIQGYAYRHAAPFALSLGLIFVMIQYLLHKENPVVLHVTEAQTLAIAIVSILFVIASCMWLARWNIQILTRIGIASMAIYLAHILVGSGARIVLSKVLHVSDIYIHVLVGCLCAIVLPMLLLKYSRRLRISFLFENPIPVERRYGNLVSQLR